MDASDSSDDDRNIPGSKKTKLQIDDAIEESEHSSAEEKTVKEVLKVSRQRTPKKRTTKQKTKSIRSKPTKNNDDKQKRKRAAPTGLNGSYWNVTTLDRHPTRSTVDTNESLENDDDDETNTSSSSEATENDKQKRFPQWSSTSSDESDDQNMILYTNKSFVTCRSPEDAFFLCQVLQDVYVDTKQIQIRWCSLVDENGDETKVDETTRFKLDYEDTLDPLTILAAIPQIVRHPDKTLSIKKEDIVETKRLLEKSIKGETLISEQMSTSTDESPKKSENRSKTRSNEGESSPTSKTKKRKMISDKTRLTTPKKRIKIVSDSSAPVSKRRRTKDIDDIENNGKSKKASPKKNVAKPVVQRKAQLFKVQSNRFLQENPAITIYHVDPFFEENTTVPFISSYIQSKLAIRAVLLDDQNLLKSLIEDVKRVASIHVTHDFRSDLTPIHYAIKHQNINLLQVLLEDLKEPQPDRCPFPEVTMIQQSTGTANIRMLGFRTAPIMASRGAREGNNALNKDAPRPFSVYNGIEVLRYALKNNCTREIYDMLIESFPQHMRRRIYDNLHLAITAGHRKLAASIVGDILTDAFHGFNALHHQVLLSDNEDLNVKYASSVVKKTKENFQVTPIHCAAINPNSKYLKELLSIMPEYNILDKYERRPIHYAAACEGPEPLEFLLSKLANFNDVDRGGNAPLHIAATHGRAINVEILLRTAKEKAESNDANDQEIHQKFGLASINRLNKSRLYPLHLAVMNNHLECVKVLLEFGAKIDALTSTGAEKLTPLMMACQRGNLKMVKHLINSGARVEARDRFKRTPLIHACMCGHAHIVSHLLNIGANPKVFDSSMNTALHYAIAYGWYFCVRLLIEAGASLNCANSWQTTCLAAGFAKGHYGLCDYLLTEHQVDINFKTDDGLTLVMLTAELNISTSTVEQFEYVVIKHKADCTCVDASGRNAFHYLARNSTEKGMVYMNETSSANLQKNLTRMATVLLQNNCEPNLMDSKAQTPLMVALECGNFILADFLIEKAKVEINCDISSDGKTLLHYFSMKCDHFNITETLLKLSVNESLKKMAQTIDEDGRSPLHYCVMKFDEFCQQNHSSEHDENLKKQYRSIVRMIEYCLQKVGCDPDFEFPADKTEEDNEAASDEEEEEEDESSNDNQSEAMIVNDDLKIKTTSIFYLLRQIHIIDTGIQHPLELFLKKTKNINVIHHKTHRTPLLEAIYLHEYATVETLLKQKSCDVNMATSILDDELQQTPLIIACKLQLLPIVQQLLNDDRCNLLEVDYKKNQAFHYLLATDQRTRTYLEVFNLFLGKLKALGNQKLNCQGEHDRTPMHVAVYHNPGKIDSINDVEQTLISNECDLVIKDDQGNIPLHNIFLNKQVGSDPVDICVLLIKSMKSKDLDTKNKEGNTPLHLAVINCSTVCVLLLQEKGVSLLTENNLSNSIIGSCIVMNHLNLFITFLHQSIDIDLSKTYAVKIGDSTAEESDESAEDHFTANAYKQQKKRAQTKSNHQKISKTQSNTKETKNLWQWKYLNLIAKKAYENKSLVRLIIERDWQGALSLILNESERFHLKSIQVLEAAIVNGKLNLTLRLLTRIHDRSQLNMKNSEGQNLFHLIANHQHSDSSLATDILEYLDENGVEWNLADKHGSYPLHYACVQQNFIVIEFLQRKHLALLNFHQADGDGNSAYALLFWSLGTASSWDTGKLSMLISSGRYIDCLCKYENESAMNPLSFGHLSPSSPKTVPYPSSKSDHTSTNVRSSPLINAIVHNNFLLAKFILELGADVNFADDAKQTPLMHAVRQNNIDLVKLLMNKTYTPKVTDDSKNLNVFARRPRKIARRCFMLGANTLINDDQDNDDDGSTDRVVEKFTMTSSIDLNVSDALGRTCVHHLVQPFPDGSYTNNIELLRLLHSSGASLTKLDLTGLSPLKCAAINGCQHLCDALTELIEQPTEKPQAIIERFYITDPNEKLLTSTDFYHDAQTLIDQHAAAHPPKKFNSAYKVDPLSKMSQTGEVLIDADKDEPYDVHLTKTDVDYGYFGFYNFYRMQIIKHKSKNNLYILFTRWGRIGGGNGEHQSTPFSNLEECSKEFCKIFREKTGNLWKDTDQFQVKPKKYTLLKLNERERQQHSELLINFELLRDEKRHVPSKLQSSVYKHFFETLVNPQAMRANINKTRLDVAWMPVSRLRRETLEEARDLLDQLKRAIDKKNEHQLKYNQTKNADSKEQLKTSLDAISKLTNKYYSIVPSHGYGDEALPMIDDESNLKQQQNILRDILELELSYKLMLGAQANIKDISPYDYLYKSMNCKFEAMNKNDIDSQLILRYIWASSAETKVEQIFKIARPDEDRRLAQCNVPNHNLLWHGTNICNLMSILSRGLLVGPLSARTTGSLFGTGIYTADVFSKSLNYCTGVRMSEGERCFILLCEVALGHSKEIGGDEDDDDNNNDDDDCSKPLDTTKYQSRKGVGRRIPDPRHTITRNYGVRIPLGQLINNISEKHPYRPVEYNEYIVYDEAQVALRYLVQFRR